MSELDGWLLDEYRAHQVNVDVAPTTLKGQLVALKQLLDFCVSILKYLSLQNLHSYIDIVFNQWSRT